MRNRFCRGGWRRCFSYSGRKSWLVFLLFIVLWFYTMTSFILLNRDDDRTDSQLLKGKILDLSKRYVKAVALEKGGRGVGKIIPDVEGSYEIKKTLAVLIDNLLTRVDYLENKVNALSAPRPGLDAAAATHWTMRNDTKMVSTSKLASESVDESSDHKAVKPRGIVENQRRPRELAGEDQVEIPGDRRPGSLKHKLQQLEGKCSYTDEELTGFPNCMKKTEWMRMFWNSDKCYGYNGVDGTDCTIFLYLSEVEKWCPKFSWRPKTSIPIKQSGPKAIIQKDKNILFAMMDNPEKFRWMKMRISRMWDTLWMPAVKALDQRGELSGREQKKILIHLGLLTKESGFKIAEKAFSGGPLGELVQWADIITSLFILGHDISLSYSTHRLTNLLRSKGIAKSSCPTDSKMPFDVVYIDIVGLKQMRKSTGGVFNQFKCMLRVIDTFGTEPAFNAEHYAKATGHRSSWGKWNLVPRQFMTMFPHTPDNSFMGFVVEHYPPAKRKQTAVRQQRALVYGKDLAMWKDASRYLNTIHEKFEIHGTVFQNETVQFQTALPSYVRNHGIVNGTRIQQLLQETKLFIGLGFPYEGPAPLEAIANGCIFLNPSFDPPKNAKNTKFFEGKPTQRAFSSQHPYAEMFIGKPHVWTVNIYNRAELEGALQEISNIGTVEPLLPFEYTCEGMLQRVSAYVQHQDYCSSALPTWPPLSALQVMTADDDVSCKKACSNLGLVCEPSFFHHINKKNAIEEHFATTCSSEESVEDVYPPALKQGRFRNKCYLQLTDILFSCAGSKAGYRRLCPCRDFIHGQVALCRDCL